MNKNSYLMKFLWDSIKLSPTRIIVFYFTFVITTGTFLLSLPISQKQGNWTSLIDAFFTSCSATCVTGLVVHDTYTYWSTFGQLVILFLIQLGGLGTVTLATLFSVMLGRKAGLKGMLLAQESISNFNFSESLKLVRKVLLFAFLAELIGAIILAIRFLPGFGAKGFYMAIFHSISAFCNAGFDLMGIQGKGEYLSLSTFSNDPLVIYTIAILIVIGGLGFLVLNNLYNYRKTKTLLLNTQLVLLVTFILIAVGSILFFTFETNNLKTIGNMTIFEKVNTSVFHAITPRTAGFNIVDLGATNDITKVLNIILMYIGAAPGSTAGGIKVTTFGIIIMTVISEIIGRQQTVVLKNRVPYTIIIKALVVIVLSLTLITVIASIILLIENKPFLTVLFETTSAFGTVGLSTGITPGLHDASKLLLAITMFLGRIGPLTFAISLLMKSRKSRNDIYPEGKVNVG